ncbi:MAG: lysophospholipase [Marinosulfonomonas sp.]|nr:MAG: lysophospholipase [Marinosulfonomonas sp.]
MEDAPLFNDLAEGPEGGRAYWVKASDGVRLRIAYWPGGNKGTVLLFPGRTEYIEKYGRAAVDLLALGYSTLAIDWRGQGLADRLTDEAMLGHVDSFNDFQLDIAAMTKLADSLNCPGPRYLVGHSMGGCIGLRALHNGLDVNAVAFSGPMWGLAMARHLRPVAGPLSWFMDTMGKGKTFAPGNGADTYVRIAPFLDNNLTSDPDMYAYLQRQAKAHPELTLGGPSLSWLYEALLEMAELVKMAPPQIPTVTFLGGAERIVDPRPVHLIMAQWQGGHLEIVPDAEHEIIMEKPETRAAFFAAADNLFSKHPG